MSENIKTVLHHYRFDISKAEQKAAYLELVSSTLSKIGFPVWKIDLDCAPTQNPKGWKFAERMRKVAGPVGLETNHLFDNQWNSAPIPGVFEDGLRLFNWTEYIYPNKDIKEGYYLDQTSEMLEVLRNTLKCGFCGKQEPAQKGYTFCPHCIDSEHLKSDDLHLTRMVPVRNTNKPRATLSDSEKAHLLPIYHAAQLHGTTERGKARIAKARKDIAKEYEKSISDATEKRDAAEWIMDRMPGTLGNWIFYSHSGKHTFGWRNPIEGDTLEGLLNIISEFPFAYEIKCADGRTLEGY